MSKLTAEKARERIAYLKTWQEQRGLRLREEEYLEAMEIALRVLEAPAEEFTGVEVICMDARQYESLSVQAAMSKGLERYGEAMNRLAEKD